MAVTDDVARVLGPPAQAPRDIPWPDVETLLGVRLPDDYKWLCEHYPVGSVDEFAYVFDPVVDNPYLNLAWHASYDLGNLQALAEIGDPMPFALTVGVGGVLPWGTTKNGDYLLWSVGDADPARWTVAVRGPRDPEWFTFDGGACAFLVAVATRAAVVPFFPDNFPHDRPAWVPV